MSYSKDFMFIMDGSKFRQKVFKSLNTPKRPSLLKKSLNAHPSSLMRTLAELKKAKLIKVIMISKNCTLYVHTEKGEKVLTELNEFSKSEPNEGVIVIKINLPNKIEKLHLVYPIDVFKKIMFNIKKTARKLKISEEEALKFLIFNGDKDD